MVHLSAAGELNRVHTRNNKSPLRSLTLPISHLESFPPSSPLKNVLKYDLFKNKSCGCEGVRLEVSLTRATTPYSFTPNLASSRSYPLVGSRPSYLRVHSSRYYAVTEHSALIMSKLRANAWSTRYPGTNSIL